MIRLEFKRITNGRNVWHVSGTLGRDHNFVGTVYGDIADRDGIAEALRALVASKPRYQRATRADA